MPTLPARRLLALALLCAACGNNRLQLTNQITVQIASPAAGTLFKLTDAVAFSAAADNPNGLSSLSLFAGSVQVASCAGVGNAASHIDCQATFRPGDRGVDSATSRLVLTATATALDGLTGQAQVEIALPSSLGGGTSGTTVVIDAPQPGQSTLTSDRVQLQAHATSTVGLASMVLAAGTDVLTTCAATPSDTSKLTCQATLSPAEHAAQIASGKLTLTAQAVDVHSKTTSQSVVLSVRPVPLAIAFTAPPLTQQTPPVAAVSGSGDVTLVVTSAQAVRTVVVTDEAGRSIASFSVAPYSTSIGWAATFQAGQHTLTATVTDAQGTTASAQRTIQIAAFACKSDGDCAGGTRCCTGDGQCHPIVASGADCDCAHPCPASEGCFPGTCGAQPQKCRPGCNPGSDSPERVPDTCAPQNNVVAYCSPLPVPQRTPQNHGGACAPGDGCDVHAQNCPNLPLDRTRPQGPTNPLVAYTCEPVSATATACFPAGTHPPQDTNPGNNCSDGADTCGNDQAGCVKGYLCVGIVGHPERGQACSAQCRDPVDPNNYLFSNPPQSKDCPSGQYCDMLYGTGGQIVLTGICTNMN